MASIAKLAIQITTDTKQMSAGFRSAQDQIKGFQAQAEVSGGGVASAFGAAAAKFFTMEKALSALKAELKFIFKTAIDFQSEMAEAFGLDPLTTFKGQFSALKREVGASLDPVATLSTDVVRGVREMVDDLRRSLGLMPWSEFVKGMDSIAAAAKSARERSNREFRAMIKQRIEEAKETLKAAEKARDARRKAEEEAEDFRKKLRTPREVLDEGAIDLRGMFSKNLISLETFRRGAKGLVDDFLEASKAAKEIKFVKPNVAALEKGTTAEVSGRLSAAAAATQQAEAMKRIAAEQAKGNRLLQDILGEVAKPPVELKKGAF